MVTRVFNNSQNTFTTAVCAVKRPSGFFKHPQYVFLCDANVMLMHERQKLGLLVPKRSTGVWHLTKQHFFIVVQYVILVKFFYVTAVFNKTHLKPDSLYRAGSLSAPVSPPTPTLHSSKAGTFSCKKKLWHAFDLKLFSVPKTTPHPPNPSSPQSDPQVQSSTDINGSSAQWIFCISV